MNRFLLAVDGSQCSMRAAALAGELSEGFGAIVDIINVVSNTALIRPTGAYGEYAQLENVLITQKDLLRSAGTDVVAQAAKVVGDSGGKVDEATVEIGSPAHVIVETAEGRDADCIVMGRRGLSDFKGLMMGSISHRVGHLTDTTLITVA